MGTRRRVFNRLAVAVMAVAGAAGCGSTMMAAGADVAASGASRGTERVASGNGPSTGDAVVIGAGVALMVAGYQLTPPDRRAPNAAAPSGYTPQHRPPLRR
jgi:hypothetical protein